jgi:hypothetical protein
VDLSGGGDLFGGADPVVAGSPESAKAHQESYLRHGGGPPEDGSGRRPGCLRILASLVVIAVVLALAVWGLGEVSKLIG